MAKLSQKQESKLRGILAELETGIDFLKRADLHVMRETNSTTTDVWAGPDGKRAYSMNKDIGSNLCYLYNAKQHLEQFLTPVIVETETL
jgi:hypothetical protein